MYLPLSRQPLGLPFEVNRASPQARGLVGWWPFVRPVPREFLQGTTMTAVGGADFGASIHGSALRCDAATEGLTATAPGHLRLNPPITVAMLGMFVGTPSASVGYAGVLHSSSAVSPFTSYLIGDDGGANIRITGNIAGAFTGTLASAARPATGTLFSAVGVFADGRQDIYINGVAGSGSTMAWSSIAYDATAPVVVGNDRAVSGRTSNCHIYDVRIYSRALSAAEVWALYAPSTRWELYGVPVGRVKAATTMIWPGVGSGAVGGIGIGRVAA